ncbi:MAG TPA: PepSY-associated TM helix domain-containing protein [Gammaproteobacteria bacterium]
MLRKIVFWAHLVCGVAAGLVIAMMSLTGVLLTYERQILAWADRGDYEPPPQPAERLPIETLLGAVKLHAPDFEPTAITLARDPGRPASVTAGRNDTLLVDPYRGQVLGRGAEGLRSFFQAVTGWHRWFNASGENRALARAVTGASNLAFLFLILSGLYLWLPPAFKWVAFRTRLWFNPYAKTAKARDFNWHHVFGIWSAIPLAVVVATAVVFSYGWANALVYRAFGEEPPAGRGGRGGPPPAAQGGNGETPEPRLASAAPALPLDALFARAAAQSSRWQTITLTLPSPGSDTVRFTIDEGTGGEPQHRHGLTLDSSTGEVREWQPFSSQSPGRRARSYVRFLHTGEALGLVGQTIAGIVSLTSLVMVWTGLALAYRRLVVPLFRRQ